MRKILTSLLVIGIVFSGVFTLSQAFFSDTETSSGNVLSAGTIDLQIGNSSYYNGQESESTSWELDDLNDQLFFNFTDIKPGDTGEDTISLSVTTNSAWACADLTITQNDDNTCTEPELIDDTSCSEGNSDDFDGELAQNLEFIFWVDNGDNVLETGEEVLIQGTADHALNQTFTLADSLTNNLGDSNGTPMQPGQTYFIGKAWCFGDLEIDGENITCDGTQLDNATQSDILKGDISFYAVQSRNNEDFVCGLGQLIETLEVPSTTSSPTSSTTTLANGTEYTILAQGTYTYWPNCGISPSDPDYPNCRADAEFSNRPAGSYGPGWKDGETQFPPTYPAETLDLVIDGANINWGSFTTSHIYQTTLTGGGSTLDFAIKDNYYPDNSGSLTVKIYESL